MECLHKKSSIFLWKNALAVGCCENSFFSAPYAGLQKGGKRRERKWEGRKKNEEVSEGASVNERLRQVLVRISAENRQGGTCPCALLYRKKARLFSFYRRIIRRQFLRIRKLYQTGRKLHKVTLGFIEKYVIVSNI